MKQINLLEGSIAKAMTKMALPVMGTAFIQMAYNLVDMIWIGHLGAEAVASVGAAGMFMWLANGISLIPRVGGQVTVGQQLGAKNKQNAQDYAASAISLSIVLAVLYGVLTLVFHQQMIAFFHLNSAQVIQNAESYLMIVCGLILFNFISQTLSGILAATGNTLTTFRVTTTGLLLNLVLDPLLIFGLGPFPQLGVTGAAIATVFAQLIVLCLYLIAIQKNQIIFNNLRIVKQCHSECLCEIIRIGLPSAIQDSIFSIISMIIARIVAEWGDTAVAVQKVGSQIESISWMTAEGFAMAVNAFTAQNYGAEKRKRVARGFQTGIGIMAGWGIFTSLLLIVFPGFFFKIFITEAAVIPMGIDYLRIIGLSEIFMCLEGVAFGAFQGIGKTKPPAVCGILFNTMRIPLALFLTHYLGLNGVWWALTCSCIFKGTILPLWFTGYLRNYLKKTAPTL